MSVPYPTDAHPSGQTGSPAEPVPTNPPRLLRLGVTLVVVATAAALFTALLGESGVVAVKPEQVWLVTMGNRHPATTAATVEAAGVTNVARVQALLGLSLGLAIGTSVTLAFHTTRRLVHAAMTGLCAGAVVGFGAARVAVPLFYRYRTSLDLDLLPSILLHGGLAASIGLTTGLAAAIGASFRGRRLVETLFVTSAVAFLGGALYDVLGAAFFANDETGEPVSLTYVTRLLSCLIVSICIALGTTVALNQKPGTAPRSAAP